MTLKPVNPKVSLSDVNGRCEVVKKIIILWVCACGYRNETKPRSEYKARLGCLCGHFDHCNCEEITCYRVLCPGCLREFSVSEK